MNAPDDAKLLAMADQAHALLRDYVEGILWAIHMRRGQEDDTDLTLNIAIEVDRGPYTRDTLCCMLAIALMEVEKARHPR